MKISFLLQTNAYIIAFALFSLMILSTFLGKKYGEHVRNKTTSKSEISESSNLTALLFFLLAFTFGMSGSRYESRKAVIIEEANDIGTAILRSDLYPDSLRTQFRADFKDYVEARIGYYEAGANVKGILEADSLTQLIASKLWIKASLASRNPANLAATQQMIPALNNMIDITTTRLSGEKNKVPESILIMLFSIACIIAFYGGYAKGRKGNIDWLVETGFCLLVSLVILFTLDLDRSRRGMLNLDGPNQTIIELRNEFE